MYLKQYEEVKIMRITDLLSKESIRLDGVSSTKKETIRAMADLMEKSGKISDKNAYVEGLIKREEENDVTPKS